MNEVATQLKSIAPGDFPSIGLPRNMFDVNAMAKRMGLPFKPLAAAEMGRAVRSLPTNAKITRKPSGFVAVATAEPRPQLSVAVMSSKGSEAVMPAASIATKTAPLPTPKHRINVPKIIAPNLKACSSPEVAYRAGMAMLAGIGRNLDARHAVAEVFTRERHMQVFDATSIGDTQRGGYLVSDELSELIIVNMARIGAARRIGAYVPMNSSRISIPVEVSGPQVQYVSEMGALSPPDASWGQVSVDATKRGVLGYVSSEMADDALVYFVDTYADSASRALASVEDRELVLADGTSDFGGAVGLISSLDAGGHRGGSDRP